MTKHTIETVTFKLNDGVSSETFVKDAQAINDFVSKRNGFISRRLSCDDEGFWIEHIEWKTLEDAKAAAAEIGNEPALAPCMEAIDGSSVKITIQALK
ncbi:MAG: hypothetical protein HRU28_15255 [Rhizobiales bacterium]|nr:hypothetical protein [Hyphomicrobiales bacterium]